MKRMFLFLPAIALLGLGAYFSAPYIWRLMPAEISQLPETIVLPAGEFTVRMPGQFRLGTRIVDGPLQTKTISDDIAIMKYQVSQSEYVACVTDGACESTNHHKGDNLPQVDVSYYDAVAYAKWFSQKTKRNWRLPNVAEWRRAADDKYIDISYGDLDDARDPAKRWLLEYANQVNLRGKTDLDLRPRGESNENNLGIADISANIWEWTDTCFVNAQLDPDSREILKDSENCAVRAVEGKHTAFVIEFVRDAKVGGCAAGIPPDYLGFRLVLDG